MWLKLLRIKAGLSQAELSKRVGMTQQYYSAIESGKRGQTLPTTTAKRIACVLGFPWTRFYDEPAQDSEVQKGVQS